LGLVHVTGPHHRRMINLRIIINPFVVGRMHVPITHKDQMLLPRFFHFLNEFSPHRRPTKKRVRLRTRHGKHRDRCNNDKRLYRLPQTWHFNQVENPESGNQNKIVKNHHRSKIMQLHQNDQKKRKNRTESE